MSTAKEMQDQHGNEQREENNVLLRSMRGMMMVIGCSVIGLLFTGVCVGVADHFKLISVGELVAKLTVSTDKVSADTTARNLIDAGWHANMDTTTTAQKADLLALTNRILLLESEVRQTKKP